MIKATALILHFYAIDMKSYNNTVFKQKLKINLIAELIILCVVTLIY
jgi:hypothetical protein